MKLEVGKKYRAGNGDIVEIIKHTPNGDEFCEFKSKNDTYYANGTWSKFTTFNDKDLIEEVKETMFKKGDRVRCLVSDIGYYTKGKTYTVLEDMKQPYRVRTDDDTGNANGWAASHFELVKNVELDKLIETANNGYDAIRTLYNDYRGEFKHLGDKGSDITDTVYLRNTKAWKIEKVELPKFEPYTIGRWNVELRNDVLYIGCKQFDARILTHDLNILASSNEATRNELYANRKGVNYKSYSLTWEQVDTLLEKLKKVGF